jgi:peptide-methionine (R)-S-oxide reductase
MTGEGETMRGFAWLALVMGLVGAVAAAKPASSKIVPVVKTDAEWRKLLTAEQYRVLRTEGTEIAFTGKYWDNHAKGTYVCAGCGLPLFASSTKFDSGTGWPSFWQPIAESNIHEVTSTDYGIRIEVECARCGGHLGHVFDDGPRPTGLRYCINSAALAFVPAK